MLTTCQESVRLVIATNVIAALAGIYQAQTHVASASLHFFCSKITYLGVFNLITANKHNFFYQNDLKHKHVLFLSKNTTKQNKNFTPKLIMY